MSSPAKEDLPKVPNEFKNELEKFDAGKMKHTETKEKNCLPSKEDIKQEKQHLELLEGVSKFNKGKLKRTDTLEKDVLPTKEDVIQEKKHHELLKGVSTFNKAKLKRTNTQEKIVLPTKEVLTQEKVYEKKQEVLKGVTGFDRSKLRKTKTVVKNFLPTKEEIIEQKADRMVWDLHYIVIEQEKGNQAYGAILQGIESFDPAKLKPTETQEKNPLPTKEVIDQEKSTAA